jgi:hypothetical protein
LAFKTDGIFRTEKAADAFYKTLQRIYIELVAAAEGVNHLRLGKAEGSILCL